MIDILIAVSLNCHASIVQDFISFNICKPVLCHLMLCTVDLNDQFMTCNIKINNIITEHSLTIYRNR